jgi:hypothetical protein
MSTRISPGGEGGRCVRLTTYHSCSAERQEVRGLNLPGTPVGLLGLSVGVTFTYNNKGKSKDVPVHAMKSYRGSGDIAPLILKRDTRLR